MLSLKKLNENSVPICQIRGGKHDEKIVYFNEGGDSKNNEIEYNMKINGLLNDMMDDDQYFGDLKGASKKKAKVLMREHIVKNIEPLDDDFRKKYYKVKGDIEKKGDKILEIVDGEMTPVCNKNKHCHFYICGPSGVGKSHFMNTFAKSYMKVHPKRSVILFSKLDEDPTLDSNKHIKRITINNEIIDEPIDVSELKDSLVLFDDTLMIRDSKLNKEINERLLKDVLETGRHHQIDTCISNHLINQYQKTRPMMNEATNLVFFTRGGNKYGINYCLKNYVGLDKHQIQKIFKIPSTRWIMVVKTTAPMCIVHQHGVYILDDASDSLEEEKVKPSFKVITTKSNNKFVRKPIKKSKKQESDEEEEQDTEEEEEETDESSDY